MLAAVSMATLPPFSHSMHESVSHLGGLKVIFDESFDRWRPVFLGRAWQHRPKARVFLSAAASTSVCPQLLGEPHCTYGGIPDTTLKQQGTKQQQPGSWSFLVKKQAGQRLSSRFLIPLALWDCRARLYSRRKLKHKLQPEWLTKTNPALWISSHAWVRYVPKKSSAASLFIGRAEK